jgi:hypothetical protein
MIAMIGRSTICDVENYFETVQKIDIYINET